MDIEEARRRLAEHPPKGDPTNIAFGETLDEKAARFYREPDAEPAFQPRRGDAVETWLKAERDEYAHGGLTWSALSNLIDTYRHHADTGTPLGQGVSDGGPDA